MVIGQDSEPVWSALGKTRWRIGPYLILNARIESSMNAEVFAERIQTGFRLVRERI
jgi:hypothetical protein